MAGDRYALIRDAGGLVVNLMEYDMGENWAPPAGHSIVPDPAGMAQIGGTWTGSAFTDAPPLPDRLTPRQQAAIARLSEFVRHAPGTSGAQADQFLALTGDATLTQLTAAVKGLIRNDRAIATILHMLIAETAEEED